MAPLVRGINSILTRVLGRVHSHVLGRVHGRVHGRVLGRVHDLNDSPRCVYQLGVCVGAAMRCVREAPRNLR